MRKRFLATVAAISLAATTLAAPVSAAETRSFSEIFSEQLDKGIDELLAAVPESSESSGVTANISLAATEIAGQTLTEMVGIDLTWLSSVSLVLNAGLTDGLLRSDASAFVNGEEFFDALLQIDPEEKMLLMQIPAVSDAYLSANLLDAYGEYAEDVDAVNQIATLYADYYANGGIAAHKDEISTLLKEFYAIYFEAFDAQDPTDDVVTAEGISQEATRYEASINTSDALAIATELATYIQDSEEFHTLLVAPFEGEAEGEELYESLQGSISEFLTEIEDVELEEEEEEQVATMTFWLDSEDNFIGSSTVSSTGAEEIVVEAYETADGDNRALEMTFASPDFGAVQLHGLGTVADGLLAGTYVVTINGTDYANIEVLDYDTASAQEGYINGSYAISILPDALGEDAGDLAGILGASVLYIQSVASEEGGSIDLALDIMGETYFTGTLSAESAAAPAPMSIGEDAAVYDFNNSEEFNAYMETVKFMSVLAKLTQAGVPVDMLSSVTGE